MWLKFKNVATAVIETFHLLLLTLLLGQTFHVQQQFDDIVVMASSTTIITTLQPTVSLTTTLTHKTFAKGAKAVTGAAASSSLSSSSALPLLTPTSSTSALSSISSLSPTSLWQQTPANASKLLNLTLPTVVGITDYNESDTASDDTDTDTNTDNNQNPDYIQGEQFFLTKDYVMAKHIALPDDSTRIAMPEMMTTSSISSKLGTAQQGPQVTLVTPSMSTATQHYPSAATATSSSSLPFASLGNHRSKANRTRFNELSTLSLLSLNDDTSAEIQSSNFTSFISNTASNQAATILRVKGNEQNMHNTNSHLIVDNRNATIVASRSGPDSGEGAKTLPTAASFSSMSNHQHQHHHNHNTNTNLTAAGRNKSHRSNNTTTSDITNSSRNSSLTSTAGHGKVNSTGTTRISARRVEHKYILPKPHKTDAPMLNYIFDTFSSANKHHHHDQRYGPHFEDVQLVGKPTNMTVQAGSSIHLNCRISLLQDKTVSWVRRNSEGEDALDLLTVGLHAYTGDKRYKMEFQYPNNWRLKISNVKKDDEATYECQISTHPPRVIQINLHVNAPKVMIVDEFGDPLQEKYYEQDSTLQLSCVVRNVAMSSSVVFWKHIEDVLNYDVTRGGISVKTELMDDGANSTLFIAKINKADSGNYTCSISEYQNYTIVVHILNGESFAELHHGNAICWHRLNHQTWAINLIVLATILLILPAYVNR